MKRFLTKSTITAGIVLSAAVVSNPAMAASFVVTVEAPGVQQSKLYTNRDDYGAKNVYVENFDSQSTGYNSKGFTSTNIGTYDQDVVVKADKYGGAGGTDNYFTVQPGRDGTSSDPNQSKTTLTLKTPERYFGLWWSAGDRYNEMDFYSGNQLLEKFTTQDVINFINKELNSPAYYGNPTNNFKGLDEKEPFAFLNFFADPNNQNITFDKVVFINNSTSTGFESDNHTVASSYQTISGKIIAVPEPSAALGLGIVASVAMLSQRKKNLSKA